MTSYTTAAAVERIAEQLIEAHHKHLADVSIRYLWRDKAATSKGNVVLGKARKVSGLSAHLVHLVRKDEPPEEVEFFVLEIAADIWDTLTEAQQTALVDHELCHFGVEIPEKPDKDRRLVLRGHDLEEFAGVVERHGLWRPEIETFRAAAAAQLTLDEAMSDAAG
ncbi:MAG: putative metallopeptidase [Natronosporangium sp.]